MKTNPNIESAKSPIPANPIVRWTPSVSCLPPYAAYRLGLFLISRLLEDFGFGPQDDNTYHSPFSFNLGDYAFDLKIVESERILFITSNDLLLSDRLPPERQLPSRAAPLSATPKRVWLSQLTKEKWALQVLNLGAHPIPAIYAPLPEYQTHPLTWFLVSATDAIQAAAKELAGKTAVCWPPLPDTDQVLLAATRFLQKTPPDFLVNWLKDSI